MEKVTELLKKVNFEINISLKHLVLGYKIFDKVYFDFNYILTILGYSIYKSYYVSEQKTKAIDVYSLFVRELRSRLNVCKISIQMCCLKRYKSVLKNNYEKVYDI